MATWNNQLRTKSYNMTEEKSEFEAISDVQINDEFLAALRKAGASRLCRQIVQVDPEDVGVDRNSVRTELQKYCYWADEVSADAIEDKQSYGGHFFNAVWDGDFEGAMNRADGNNKKILEQVRGGKSTGVITL